MGVGALGLLYGARLARDAARRRDGLEVHLLMRSDYDHARARGISVRSDVDEDGTFHLPPDQVRLHREPGTVPVADLVILSTKTTANPDLPALLAPMVGERTLLLTLQNGLGNEEFLARAFPRCGGVLGGTAFVSVHRVAAATAHHQHSGHIAIGAHSALPGEVVEGVAWLLRRTGFAIQVLPSLARGRWEKQLWNVPFNGLGAAMLADTEMLLSTTLGRQLVRGVMDEVMRVAAADGSPLPEDLPEAKIHYTLDMGPYKTSMQLDREAGRAMEIESIVGSVTQRARSHQQLTPRLDLLELQLRAVDTGETKHP